MSGFDVFEHSSSSDEYTTTIQEIIGTPCKKFEIEDGYDIEDVVTPEKKLEVVSAEQNFLESCSLNLSGLSTQHQSSITSPYSNELLQIESSTPPKRRCLGYSSLQNDSSMFKQADSNEVEIEDVITPVKNYSTFQSQSPSPSTNSIIPVDSKTIDAKSPVRIQLSEKNGLANQVKKILPSFSSSIKIWPHRVKRNLISEQQGKLFQVLKIKRMKRSSIHDSKVLTLCVNIDDLLSHQPNKNTNDEIRIGPDLLKENLHWIIFKATPSNPISLKTFVKLYSPWQKVTICELSQDVLICTDFFQVLPSEETKLSSIFWPKFLAKMEPLISKEFLHFNTKSVAFKEMLPFHVTNTRTLQRQLERRSSSISLDVLICHVWKSDLVSITGWKYLVIDCDGFFSVLEPNLFPNTQVILLEPLKNGERYNIQGLLVLDRISINAANTSCDLMKLICTQNPSQNFYYRLLMSSTFSVTRLIYSDLPLDVNLPWKFIKQLQNLHFCSLRRVFRT